MRQNFQISLPRKKHPFIEIFNYDYSLAYYILTIGKFERNASYERNEIQLEVYGTAYTEAFILMSENFHFPSLMAKGKIHSVD